MRYRLLTLCLLIGLLPPVAAVTWFGFGRLLLQVTLFLTAVVVVKRMLNKMTTCDSRLG